ncbi:trypsin-like peptidase domain-containing protein [Streptomyces sp. NPDC017936]|uniref:nSTAND1 domain-containing NTPase n=1 Tax=Streptomyces sp. NPDC017936 TaxID=3365016 RepID=UPI0037A2FB64
MTGAGGEQGDDGTAADLPPAVARILGPDGAVAGAGFLVAEGILVTCAHVVEAAGGGPGRTVLLSFSHAGGADRTEGRVPAELWRAVEDEDVAFVRVDGGTPVGAGVLPLGSAEGCRGHQVRSYGFPAQARPEGHYGYGRAGNVLPSADRTRTHLQLTGANDLTTGFSGGPVQDEVTGLVIGMLTEITAPDAYERGQGIAYVTPTRTLREILPELAEREVCPYPGLEPFTAEHARWFQGRQEAVGQVLANLAQQRRLTLLLGPSGSGKSSLIQAGVLRALAEGELPGSDQWLTVLARPRQDMLAEIERAGLPGASEDGIVAAVNRRLAADPGCRRVLLVIDQFEELLVQSADGRLRDLLAVVDEVTTAADAYTKITVILIMRDDFYPQLAALAPKLLEAATPGLLNVPGTLSQRDLHDIIVLPAEDVGLRFQPGLPERIIGDVMEITPEAVITRLAPVTVLPLLSMTLNQLWHRRQDGHLTHEAYRRIGKVSGSVTTWCEGTLDELSEEQRIIARRALTSLVHPSDPSHHVTAVRSQVPLHELRDLAADPSDRPDDEKAAVDAVIATLTRRRIITTQAMQDPRHPGAAPGEPVAELIHEALIRDWGALREWVDQDHRFQEWLVRTRERRDRWAEDKDPGDLLGGTALGEASEWSRRRHLPADIAEFLHASKQRQRAAARRSRRVIAVLAGLLALAIVAWAGAVWQWRSTIAERQEALSRQLAAHSYTLLRLNPELASLLAVHAYRTSPTPESLAILRAAAALPAHRRLTGHDQPLQSVAFSPDGRTLATASDDHSVRLWNVATGKPGRTLSGHTAPVYSVAFSPDGRTLATGSWDHTARLWNVATGEVQATLKKHTNKVHSVAFSPDGRTLATGSWDHTARLWDVAGGKALATLKEHTGQVRSVAFSRDGRSLATGSADTTARIWDVPTGKSRITLEGHSTWVNSVNFSPDGKTLATASADGTALLWDTTTGETRATLIGHIGTVESVAFSPDGRTLATASTDKTAVLWDTTTGTTLRTLLGHADWVMSVAFSPDGRTLATASTDHTARLWDVTSTGRRRTTLTGHTDWVWSVAFSPDGRTLASASGDHTARLWDATTGELRTVLEGHEDEVYSVAFSPDGRTLATGGADHSVRLWDVATGKSRTPLKHEDEVYSVAFSPDGRTLATGGADHSVRLWDVATGKRRASLAGHYGPVNAVAFSPDGRTFATGSDDGTVGLWDVATSSLRTLLTGHTDEVMSVDFSRDGKSLASGSRDYTARLWDVATGKTRTVVVGQSESVDEVAFTRDGHTLATVGADSTVRLWDSATGAPRATMVGHTFWVASVAISPDGNTFATGSGDLTVRLWTARLPQPGEAIQQVCRRVGHDLTPDERTAYLPGRPVDRVCPSN